MAVRRTGSPTSFWNNVAVGVAGVSNVVEVPRGAEQVAVFVTVSAATTVTVQIAHHGANTSQGSEPDHGVLPTNFFNLYYINTACQIVFAAAGSIAMIIPDFEPNWIRLSSSAAATITAGHEVTGE